MDLWELYQLSRWCPAVKPWEWLDHPDWFEEGRQLMRVDNDVTDQKAKKQLRNAGLGK